MSKKREIGTTFVGICLFLGLFSLGYFIQKSAVTLKEYDRVVTVKGLAEKEYPADRVLWPIQFTAANSDLAELYAVVENNTAKIQSYLLARGIEASEIAISPPAVTDKLVQDYNSPGKDQLRYSSTQTITVYSNKVEKVRLAIDGIVELGKQGIAFKGANDYENKTEYSFTKLNEIKPAMVEEATRNAREVAQKFAKDSSSTLGRIKTANQGQFSIESRDKNNPNIKKVRVVSTIEYYLSD